MLAELRRAAQAADPAGCQGCVQDCHPHRFRHPFAVNFLSHREAAHRNGGNAFELQMVQTCLALAQADPSTSSGQAWMRRIGRRHRCRDQSIPGDIPVARLYHTTHKGWFNGRLTP